MSMRSNERKIDDRTIRESLKALRTYLRTKRTDEQDLEYIIGFCRRMTVLNCFHISSGYPRYQYLCPYIDKRTLTVVPNIFTQLF